MGIIDSENTAKDQRENTMPPAGMPPTIGHNGDPSSSEQLVSIHKWYGANHYAPYPIVMSRADGMYIWDKNGKRYLDLNAQYSVNALGHNHPRLKEALVKQLDTGLTGTQNVFLNEHAPLLELKIAQITGLPRVVIMNTGAEGVDTAIKLALRYAHKRPLNPIPPDKGEIIAFEGNFHGRTLNAVWLSGVEHYRDGFGPFREGRILLPYGDIEAVKKAITPHTAAVIIEPIQGEGGIRVPPAGFLSELRNICNANDIVLIFDEVQTGLGRTGKLFAFEHSGVKPDLIILGKALGQLVPVSAVAGRNEIMNLLDPGSHGSTFAGTALPCAVALESLKLIEENGYAIVRNSREVGAFFKEQLEKALADNPCVLEIRGVGLFIGIKLDKTLIDATSARTRALRLGLITGAASDNVLRLSPPLICTKKHVVAAIPLIVEALSP